MTQVLLMAFGLAFGLAFRPSGAGTVSSVPDNLELREDGAAELREDGGYELRE